MSNELESILKFSKIEVGNLKDNMADKEKSKIVAPTKTVPKDGVVILAIMKEMGLVDYEPKTIIQLTEFVYRYATTILEESRVFANNCKKKFIDVEDVRAALHLCNESRFTTPPSREVIMELSRNRNNNSLPPVKPQSGLRLPADRHCLSSTNYVLKSNKKSKIAPNAMLTPGIKIVTKPTVSYIKRTNIPPLTKQTITVPKSITNISNQQKGDLKPKIQIQQNQEIIPNKIPMPLKIERNDLKRKREDDML